MDGFSKTIDIYNKHAQDLAVYFDGIGSRVNDVKQALSFVEKDNPKVIEVGCGNGRDAKSILQYTHDYAGFDASFGMVSIARKSIPGVSFEVSDFLTYKYPQRIDIIFAFASLLHSSKVKIHKFFRKVSPHMSSGGIIYISLKYGDYHKEIKKDKFGSRLFYFYTPEDIKTLAGVKYEFLYTDSSIIGHTQWFVIILRKK